MFLFKKQLGMILVLVVTVMAAMLLLVTYFLDFIITEKKIAQSQYFATETYYLTEAGIQQAIWKIKNDPIWLSSFQTDPAWQTTLDQQNPFQNNQSYHISVQNNGLGRAEIIATGWLILGEKQSQRVVKTTIFQAQGSSPTSSIALFTDKEMNFSGANIQIEDAGIFANKNIKLNLGSNITIEGNAEAGDKIDISWTSHLSAAELFAKNYPPAPQEQEMAQLDFDSKDAGSFLNRATVVYKTKEFDDLIAASPNLQLNGIIFIDGNVSIPRGTNLTVNGVLVSKGNIDIGTDWWPFWLNGPTLTINDLGAGPAGLLSKRKINIGSYTNSLAVNGLLYANDEFKINAYGLDFSVTGSIVTRRFEVSSLWQQLVINYDQNVVNRTLGLPLAAPVINVDHWEEEY